MIVRLLNTHFPLTIESSSVFIYKLWLPPKGLGEVLANRIASFDSDVQGRLGQLFQPSYQGWPEPTSRMSPALSEGSRRRTCRRCHIVMGHSFRKTSTTPQELLLFIAAQ